jgi:hypothetical protein
MNVISPQKRTGEADSHFEIVFVHERQFPGETGPLLQGARAVSPAGAKRSGDATYAVRGDERVPEFDGHRELLEAA